MTLQTQIPASKPKPFFQFYSGILSNTLRGVQIPAFKLTTVDYQPQISHILYLLVQYDANTWVNLPYISYENKLAPIQLSIID